MDVDHVLMPHHSQVCVWVFVTHQTWTQFQISLLFGKLQPLTQEQVED